MRVMITDKFGPAQNLRRGMRNGAWASKITLSQHNLPVSAHIPRARTAHREKLAVESEAVRCIEGHCGLSA